MPIALRFAATGLSALAFGFAFPPASIRWLAWIALVPLLIALRASGLGAALLLSWGWTLLAAWIVGSWMPQAVATYFQQPLWLGYAVFVAVSTSMGAIYYMAFALIDRRIGRCGSLFAPLLTAAAWVGIELARGRLFTGSAFLIGNPWGLLGYTHASGSLAQIASWTGVYGISFAIVAVNAGIAGWIDAARDSRRSTARAGWAALLSALPAAVFAVGGAFALRAASAPTGGAGLSEVGVVQGNVAIGRHWRSEYFAKNLDVYLDLTRRALQAGAPATIVWPESAVHFFLEAQPFYSDAIAAVAQAADVEILVGGPGGDGAAGSPVFNSLFVVSPDGRITARYDKEFLVPFSEYFPLRSVGLVQRRFDGARSYSAGVRAPAPIPTRLGRAGLLVCNEAMLPEVAAARVRAGAEILISPSNDSWIPGEGFAEHMLAIVRLRAIEQRRYLVRASTSGPSAVVDPWGRVPVRTQVDQAYILRGAVRAERELTPYARLGDAFAVGCALVVAVALLSEAVSGRLSKPGSRSGRG